MEQGVVLGTVWATLTVIDNTIGIGDAIYKADLLSFLLAMILSVIGYNFQLSSLRKVGKTPL